jgi:hypothetical protein
VMEAICILHDVPKLLDIGRVENLLWHVHSLVAEPAKVTKQRSRWEVFGTSYTEECLEVRAQRPGGISFIACAGHHVFTKSGISPIMLVY